MTEDKKMSLQFAKQRAMLLDEADTPTFKPITTEVTPLFKPVLPEQAKHIGSVALHGQEHQIPA